MHDGDDSDDYDPYEHRNIEKPITDLQTLVLLVKVVVGVAVLTLPDAFEFSGWINGVISNFIIGGLSTNGFHMLVRSQYILCKRHRVPLLTYPETMQLALEKGPRCLRWLSKTSLWMPDAIMIAYEIAVCSVYILFSAQNIKQITDYYWVRLDVRIFIAAFIAPVVIIFMIRNLQSLAIISQLANIMMITGFVMLFYYLCQDLPPLAKRKKLGTIQKYPLYFAPTLFAMTSVRTTLSIENNMKNPKNFGGSFGILNIGSVICVSLYTLVGFLGYWKYGIKALPSITLNVPQDEILGQTIKILFALAIYISYALQGHAPVEIWLRRLKKYNPRIKHPLICEFLIRVFVVLISFTIAVVFAEIDFIISLLGALCESLLIILFPALVEMCVLYPDKYGRCNYLFFKCFFLIMIGLTAWIGGTFFSIVCFASNILAGHYIHYGRSHISPCKLNQQHINITE